MGASVVNALSEELIATVHKNGTTYQQVYHRGIPAGDIKKLGKIDVSGTTVKFKPDDQMFETTKFSYTTLNTMLKYSAYLTSGVTFTIVDEITGLRERFYYEGGIKTRLQNIVGEQRALSPISYVNQEGNECRVEVAFQYVDSPNDSVLSFVNNITTSDGGTHVIGFKNALLSVINEFAKAKGKVDSKIGEFQLSDVTDGLYAIVTVKIPEPQFEGQTKGKLGNSYVKKEVESVMMDYLKAEFSRDENIFLGILEKITLSARARLAAKLAKESVLRKSAFAGGVLPGKLTDCSNK